jgi:hypothetical protein
VMQRVINFSGGSTSAYMTIKQYKPDDIVLFCDTGREHDKTYKFLNDFEAHEGIPIVRVKRTGGFEGILERRGNKTLPNRMRRFCTGDLKIDAAKQYLRSIGIQRYINIIGFRYDEPKRVKGFVEKFKKVTTIFPLYDAGITKQQINEYWNNKSYKLEIPHILGNCTLCFMKGKNAIMAILASYPELAAPWIEDEEKNMKKGHTYLPEVSIRQLRDMAQSNLFRDYDLNEMIPAFNCACTT